MTIVWNIHDEKCIKINTDISSIGLVNGKIGILLLYIIQLYVCILYFIFCTAL